MDDEQGTRPVAARTALTAGRVLVGMASAVVLVATGTAYSNVEGLSMGIIQSEAIPANAPKSTNGAVNILLMGLDSRKDQNGNPLPPEILDKLHAGTSDDGGYNTNTLILLHVPNNGSRATAISIPRDDYVDVQGIRGYKKIKIKEAYGLAKYFTEQDLNKKGVNDRHTVEQQAREAGRKKSIETVRDFLGGIPIDHFAELNLAGFYDLATALDGVEVCLNNPVKDDYSGADFHAGRQTLDGAQALAFVRQRHYLTNGDLDRTRRQQAFLTSAAHKLRAVGVFNDPGKLRKLIDVVKRDVVIDSGVDAFSFAQQTRALGGNVDFVTLPIDHYARDDSGQDINIVDVPKIQAMVRDLISEKPSDVPQSRPAPVDPLSTTPAQQGTLPPSTEVATPDAVPNGNTISGGDIPCVD
jgi:LCP family protein required for cell wall assembly